MRRCRLSGLGFVVLLGLCVAVLVQPVGATPRTGTIVVRLGKHVFGHTLAADQRVVDARWGHGPGQVGLVHEERAPTGGSSFDVVRGIVCVLDEHNGRVLVFKPGTPARSIPLRMGGLAGSILRSVESDLAVGADGTIYVLEPSDSIHHTPTLRSFPAAGGQPLAAVATGGESVRTAGTTALVSRDGPLAHWRPLMDRGRVVQRSWLRYRPFADGSRLEVRPDAPHGIVRAALTRPDGTRSSWLVTSPTSFAVDAVEVARSDVVLVLQMSTDTQTEFEVAVLGRHGLVRRFSVPFQQYAVPFLDGDFRVDGSSLYHLGSTGAGLYVDRYTLPQ